MQKTLLATLSVGFTLALSMVPEQATATGRNNSWCHGVGTPHHTTGCAGLPTDQAQNGPASVPTTNSVPVNGTSPLPNFAERATVNPDGSSVYFSNTANRFLSNREVLPLVAIGSIRPDGSVDPAIGFLENRGPPLVAARRPPTLGNNYTPPEPVIGQPLPSNFGDLAATDPDGTTNYFGIGLTRYLTNQDVLALVRGGAIRPDGSINPSVSGSIEYRGPSYIAIPTPQRLDNAQTPPQPVTGVPTPARLGNAQTPQQPVTAVPTPTQLGNAQTPQQPVTAVPTPTQLGNAQTPPQPVTPIPTPTQLGNVQTPPEPSNRYPRPPTAGNNYTPPEPQIGRPTPPDFGALATSNPGGSSFYWSTVGDRHLTHQEVLSTVQGGLIRPDGSINPSASGSIEYRGPSYIAIPTPQRLDNAQTPPQPVTGVPTPTRLGNVQTPQQPVTAVPTPARLGNAQTPQQPVTAVPTPTQLGNVQTPRPLTGGSIPVVTVNSNRPLNNLTSPSMRPVSVETILNPDVSRLNGSQTHLVVPTPGRQRPSDLYRSEHHQSDAQHRECIVSGMGQRRHNTGESESVVGLFTGFHLTQAIARDLPLNRQAHAGCVITIERRWHDDHPTDD